MTEGLKPTRIEALRQSRHILPTITDYLPDDTRMVYGDRVSFYRKLHEDTGAQSIRTEFRMKRLIHEDRIFDDKTAESYVESLKAMKEAGLKDPTIVLFTPDTWMQKLAKDNPQEFIDVYALFVKKVLSLSEEAGVLPRQLQVMNEVNFKFQTGQPMELVAQMIQKTQEICDTNGHPDIHIMTTIAVIGKTWKEYTTKLIDKAGDSLDTVGFDWYPGTYVETAIQLPNIIQGARSVLASLAQGKSLVDAMATFSKASNKRTLEDSKAFRGFGRVDPYEWIYEQKDHGVLKGKTVVLAETGVTALSPDSRFQQLGYDRIIQSLDHFLLSKGQKGNDLFSEIMFFTGGHHEGVDTRTPEGMLDFIPWTLVRKDKEGVWQTTEAGKQLKNLIQTRISPL